MKYFAPGRVNLIGDHTDYNGGMVFPAALTMGTYLTITEDVPAHVCKFTSENDTHEYLIEEADLQQRHHAWVDYPLGVLKEFTDRGFRVTGWHYHYKGNLPIGAALSSSASIEVVTAFALNDLNNHPFTLLQLVQMAQHAENAFVEVNCGIMDQFASGFGKQNHAIALDCQSLNYEWVPLQMDGLKFVITNTNKKRGLVDSAYNQRRAECQQAFEVFSRELSVPALCLYTQEQFDAMAHLLSGDVLKRARHAVSEHNSSAGHHRPAARQYAPLRTADERVAPLPARRLRGDLSGTRLYRSLCSTFSRRARLPYDGRRLRWLYRDPYCGKSGG